MFRKPLRNSIHMGRKLGASAPFADRMGLINDDDRASRLERSLPWVAPQSKAFVQSLLDYHASLGGWTPKQSLYVDRMLEAARENYRQDKARNGAASRKSAQPDLDAEAAQGLRPARGTNGFAHEAPDASVTGEALKALDRMFNAAKEAKKKSPRITLAKINIVPAREGVGYAMFDNAKSGKEAFMGTILGNGTLSLRPSERPRAQVIADDVSKAAVDPGQYGKDIGSCIFCALALTDDRSLAKGYGPICAAKWNLPWGDEPKAKRAKARGARPHEAP